MIVESAEFPFAVLAVSAPLSDGTYVIYVNTLRSEDDQRAAVREMVRRIEGEKEHGLRSYHSPVKSRT